ncbi:recombinase family protein, partial [Lactococcus lactis]
DLYQQGLTEKEIERKTGINRTTFRRYRQKYNVIREGRTE